LMRIKMVLYEYSVYRHVKSILGLGNLKNISRN